MDDSLTRSSFSPSSIRTRIQREVEQALKSVATETDSAFGENADPLPKPGDAYKAAGRHGNKPDLTLHFITKDYSYEGFSYADFERVRLLPSEKPGGGPVLIVRFAGSTITEVVIEGRHLHALYHWIGLHRLPWAWEHPSPAQFSDPNAAVITRITIRQVER